VVDAFVLEAKFANVDDAASESVVLVSHKVEVVAAVTCDAYDCDVKGYPYVFVKLHVPAENVQPIPDEHEFVVVATPIHPPFKNARVCPALPAKRLVVAFHVGRPVVYETPRYPPSDEVASAVRLVPPLPKTSEPSASDERPVPPPETFKVPERFGVKRREPLEARIFCAMVSPLNDCVVVENVRKFAVLVAYPEPKVVVAALYTFPFASTASSPLVRPVNHWVPTVSCVVEALVEEAKFAKVLDAASESVVLVSQRVEVVAAVTCDAYDCAVNGYPYVLVKLHVPAENVQPTPELQELVVVATHVGMPLAHARTCPFEPPVSVSAAADAPMTETGLESERTPDAVSDVVATVPSFAGTPLVVVQYERLPAISFADVATLLLKVIQSFALRQPRMDPDAVLQVTAPPEYVRPVENVVVAAAYTFPLASTPRPLEVRPVNHCVPMVAKDVDA